MTAYLDEHIPNIFKHFDNNNKGYIIVEEAPQALHMLLGEVEIGNGLQVQLDEDVSKSYRPNPVQSPWAASPAPEGPSTKITGGFAADHEKHHLGYEREVPDKYADDLFMKSLITKWSIEGKNGDGSKNGHFFMTKDHVLQAAQEVVQTHLGFTGSKRDAFINERLDKLWAHHDVLKEGFIETDKAAVLLRSMIGEVESQIGLQ